MKGTPLHNNKAVSSFAMARGQALQLHFPRLEHLGRELGAERLGTKAGQAMILSVLAMGGIFLGATVVAGVLMVSQIRQATDFKSSTVAIAAADAGIEWALYQYTHPEKDVPMPGGLSNKATVEVWCLDKDKKKLKTPDGKQDCKTRDKVQSIISSGEFNGANRIFEISDIRPFVPNFP